MATDNTKQLCANCGGIMTYVIGNDFTHGGWKCDKCGRMDYSTAHVGMANPDPITGLMKCDYCNGGGEQKPLFHENNYEPHTRMQSYIEISESSYGKKPLIYVDLWDGANACAAFEINYCPMCGRKLEGRQ